MSRSLKPICRSLREALYLCQHAHQPSGDPGGPRVLPHGASSKGDAAHSRSPEMRLHAFHGQGFRQILHHDDWGYDFVLEPSCGFGFSWLEHVRAIYGFMIQAVFPPGVIAVTLSGPISCLQNQRAGGVLFGRDMASKPWLDHVFFWRRWCRRRHSLRTSYTRSHIATGQGTTCGSKRATRAASYSGGRNGDTEGTLPSDQTVACQLTVFLPSQLLFYIYIYISARAIPVSDQKFVLANLQGID